MKTRTPELEPAKWEDHPTKAGMYVLWERGRQIDIIYWSGSEHPVFELNKNAKYFGPFLLPLNQ